MFAAYPRFEHPLLILLQRLEHPLLILLQRFEHLLLILLQRFEHPLLILLQRFGLPPVPSRDAQIPSVLVIPSKKILDFEGKWKTF